jgi:hypothetical protein
VIFHSFFLFEFDLKIQFSKLVRGSLGQERMVSMIILGRYFFLFFSKISRANFSKKIIFVKYKKNLPPSRPKPGQPGHAPNTFCEATTKFEIFWNSFGTFFKLIEFPRDFAL